MSRELIKHAIQATRKAEFAKKVKLPKQQGGKTVSVFRRVAGAASNVQSLTEGTAINTFTSVTYTEVNITLSQIGEAIKYTDIANYVQLLDVLRDGIALMGEDCALKVDDLVNTELKAGTTKRYAQGLANYAALVAASTAAGKIIATDLLDSCTNLKINRAPTFDGDYVMIAAPQVTRDLMNDNDWLEAAKYSAVGKLFNGEAGKLHGVRVVEDTAPWREDTGGSEGTYAGSGGVFASYIVGKEAYAWTDIGDLGNPNSPKIIINDKPDKSDPLNQFITAGWKGYCGAKILNNSFFVVLRSLTQYS